MDACSSNDLSWPATTRSVFHPKHTLTLFTNPVSHIGHTSCDLCADPIYGLSYTCVACNFDVHTVCSQLPPLVTLPIHPHRLKLLPGKLVACDLCYEDCTSWRYRCTTCSMDIHLECALGYDDDDDDDCYYDDEIVVYDGGGGYSSGMPYASRSIMSGYYPPPPPPPMMMMMNNNQYYQPQLPMRMMNHNQYYQPRMMMPAPYTAEGQTSSGGKRRSLLKIMGRLAMSALTTSITGVPFSF